MLFHRGAGATPPRAGHFTHRYGDDACVAGKRRGLLADNTLPFAVRHRSQSYG
jgi:hypothetical protein